MAEALVEDEGTVSDRLPKGGQIVNHLLQAAAVLGDGEVVLDEVAEPRLQVNGSCFTVAEDLRLDDKPSIARGGALGRDNLCEVVGEGTDDPGLDDAVHSSPIWRDGRQRGEAHMVLEGELAEDDGDKGPDVVDGDRLGVETSRTMGTRDRTLLTATAWAWRLRRAAASCTSIAE